MHIELVAICLAITSGIYTQCLKLLFSCDGLQIVTVEGIGSRQAGYHPIQEKLNQFNGSQCGYCSPGMVMNMYSLLAGADGPVAAQHVEKAFGGNLCRCTGYRPILDAFKSLYAADKHCIDIEDLVTAKCTNIKGTRTRKVPGDQEYMTKKLHFSDNRVWYMVYSIKALIDVLNSDGQQPYMLVAGCTANGVYRRSKDLKVFVDITKVPELRTFNVGNQLIVGANTTLVEFVKVLTNVSRSTGFEYCQFMASHIETIANGPVRNFGTIAGNLMIKHGHHGFASDVYMLFETIGAHVCVQDAKDSIVTIFTMPDFLALDMNRMIILNVQLPKWDASTSLFQSYRISERAQNSIGIVNAGFYICFADNRIKNARICFGGIRSDFMRATATETAIRGRELHCNDTLQLALRSLEQELQPDWVLPSASPKYRKNLALALFYKFVLNTSKADTVPDELRSGGEILARPLSQGRQTFKTNKTDWPVGKPVNKYEGILQCSGEAKYANDLPPQCGELWAAFVTAQRVHAKVALVDATEALSVAGVRYFFSAKDLPGENNFTPKSKYTTVSEELFLSNGSVLYFNQPLGMILADSMDLANHAVRKVKILYANEGTHQWSFVKSIFGGPKQKMVIPTLKDALQLNATDRFRATEQRKTPTKVVAQTQSTKTIKGAFSMDAQYHFSMETQTTVCLPSESGGIDVYSSTQWMDFVQMAIAKCLNIPENSINMVVTRLGGSFGSKITRAAMVACAAALGCHLTNRPVRFVMTIESNMHVIGKRNSVHSEYSVQVDGSTGKIGQLTNHFTLDTGCSVNDSSLQMTVMALASCYDSATWSSDIKIVLTDAPTNTHCRAPGTLEATATIENVMEHIAFETGIDPLTVRLANIATDSPIQAMMKTFLVQCDYYARVKSISEYNEKNRWRKRGIAILPMKVQVLLPGAHSAFVAIYHRDGTVAISHGGIESGQGLNTKMVQLVAFLLDIPMEMISVKATNNLIGANAFASGGSANSDLVGFSLRKACEQLLTRLKPIRDAMPNATWSELTEAAYEKNINLSASHMSSPDDHPIYNVYGIACTEVEVDILTGNMLLSRVDIVEDVGQSLSPLIDVGQVEGAFVMGLGYWLTEQLIYDRMTGELLTDRSWNYKPPGALDIPVDFRITLCQTTSVGATGILGSKGTGEPPTCMAVSVIFAIRNAINAARKDAKLPSVWFPLGSATRPEVIFLAAENSIADYTL